LLSNLNVVFILEAVAVDDLGEGKEESSERMGQRARRHCLLVLYFWELSLNFARNNDIIERHKTNMIGNNAHGFLVQGSINTCATSPQPGYPSQPLVPHHAAPHMVPVWNQGSGVDQTCW
jgi:hypothetical protein